MYKTSKDRAAGFVAAITAHGGSLLLHAVFVLFDFGLLLFLFAGFLSSFQCCLTSVLHVVSVEQIAMLDIVPIVRLQF